MNIFDRLVLFFDRTEVSLITLIAKIVPLLVPILPAYVGYTHVVNKTSGLGFDPAFGWIYGAVVEGLGYAAIYRAVQFWENNRKYSAEKNRAPLFLAIAIYVIYLVVTLSVNVLLDYKAGVDLYKVFALGMISMLSIPAGLLMSISALHTERTNEREREKKQNRTRRMKNRTNEQPAERTNRRTNARKNERTVRRTGERTNTIPQPVNERTNEFGFSAEPNKQARLFEYVDELRAADQPIPGPTELGQILGMSKSYISEQLNGRQ